MSRLKIRAALVAPLTVLGIMAAIPQAQASVDYRWDYCGVGSGTTLQVSSWKNDSRTQKTYHFAIQADGPNSSIQSFSIRSVSWNGVALSSGTSTLRREGYRYSSYTGTTPWKGVWQRYNYGVPTTTPSCTFYI